MASKEFDKVLTIFKERLNDAEDIFREKYKRIRDARRAYKQWMPSDTEAKMHNADGIVGNDIDQVYELRKSRYLAPLDTAIAEKMISEMQANPFRFEWENTKEGPDVADTFEEELLKIYSLKNNNIEKNVAFWHAIVSGTAITQTFTENTVEERIKPDGTKETVNMGRTVSFQAYDPLSVYVDWNAKPGRVSETAEWCIVTIGYFDTDYVFEKYGIKTSEGARGAMFQNDQYVETLEIEAGTDKEELIPVREFYMRDGFRYTIVNDSVVVAKDVNSNGISGRIPINFAPIFFDPESPFGFTLWELLQPSIEVCSTAINQIADMNALNAKMPIFYIEGTMEQSGITLNHFNANQMVPLDASQLLMGNTNRQIRVADLIDKPSFPDITQSSVFLYEKGLEMIWYITGLNPTTLGGIQDKQIRNADVMQTINQAALRSNSKPVINMEQGFMNPTTWDIARIFEMFYDDFPAFNEAGITKEFLKNLKNLRVVNGSFLPGDNLSQSQKMNFVYQLAQANPNAYDLDKVNAKMLKTNGIRDINSVMRNPLELLDEQQAMAVLQLVKTQEGIQQIEQIATQKLQEAGVVQ